jgi:uncharacterized protein (TIGR02284 family)
MNNTKMIHVLNGLIQMCKNGQEGYKEAADQAKNPDLKTFFSEQSHERSRCVAELQEQVRALGGDPDQSGSATGALHRVWMSIKGTLSGKDDRAILSEVERGEDSALAAFEESLNELLPERARPIIERWHRKIKAAHDRVRLMRDTRAARAGHRS